MKTESFLIQFLGTDGDMSTVQLLEPFPQSTADGEVAARAIRESKSRLR